jgi:hypothetical protein
MLRARLVLVIVTAGAIGFVQGPPPAAAVAPQLNAAERTVHDSTRVQQMVGGAAATFECIRLHMAPGVALCQYPLVAKYQGTGSTDTAASFTRSAGL